MRSNRLLLGLLLTWGLGACADLPHDGPFDEASPLDKQAKATLAGTVKLEGEQDHGQVAVELQNPARSYTANTRNDGTFELTGVVPGDYTLRITARSFAPETRELEVGLATVVDLGVVTLAPKTATVQGNAWLEQVEGKASQNVGGVIVSFIQTASVRGAAKAPGLRRAASVTGETQRAFTIVSNADGSYVLYGVPAGAYRASASSPGVAESQLGAVEVTGEDGDVTLDDVVLRPLTGLFDIDDGTGLNPPFTAENGVTLRLFGFNALEMAFDVTTAAGDCLPAVRVPYASTRALPLAGEGANTICVKYFGEGAAETETLTRTVVRDTTPPDATLFQINGGAAASNDALARVTLNIVAADGASGVAAMKLANAAGGCTAPLAAASAEPFVSLKSWVLAATPEAGNAVCLALRDGAGNWSAPVSTSILWDAVAPSGESVAIDGNAVYTTSPRVTVQLGATGAAEMQLTDSGSFAGRPWEPYRAAVDWVLPNVEGVHTIAVRFRDAAGNLSATAQDDITLDSTPPAAPGLTIDGGAAVTGLGSVVLTTTAAGAVEMQFSNDGVFDAETRYAIAATHAWSLTAGDGVKTVFARYFDAAGNASAVASAAIVRDATPPVNGTVHIDGGALFNTSVAATASLTLSAVDTLSGLQRIRLANETGAGCAADLAAAAPEAFASTRTWTLASPGAGLEGSRTVCVSFEDAAGNWSAPVSDGVQYDTRAPLTGTDALLIDAGGAYALDHRVQLTLAATDATEMQLANEGSFGAAAWEPYRSTLLWVLEPTQGVRTVSVKFRDAAGNVAGPFSDTIELDTLAPTAASVGINGGAAFATSASVTLTLGAIDADAMQLSSDGLFDTETEEPYAASAPFSLPGTDGTKFVYARFRDRAGNWSAVASAFIVLDRSAPVAGTPLINGGAAYTQSDAVSLTLPASGAAQMYLSTSGCLTGSTWIDYVPSYAFSLGGTPGVRTVSVSYRDEAGNGSPCMQASITLDGAFSSPGFSAAVTGPEGLAGRTQSQAVWVTLSGVSADVAEVALGSDASFAGAGWQPVAAKVLFVVASGDGLKTVYVRARDAAGNLSATLTPSITLDQTGPEAPVISVSDINGDSFAVSQSQVELRWTSPSDLNLAGFEVERYIPGYTTAFARIANAGPATLTYTDSITESVGLVHIYRVRAFDNLNNYSGWSSNIEAYPFEAIAQAAWLINADGVRYLFAPNRGTFSLRASRSYEDVAGSLSEEELGVDLVAWQHTGSAGEFGEKLNIKTVNQDNSLAYESVIPTREPQRTLIHSAYRFVDLEVDAQGRPHVLDCAYPKLGYGVRTGASWAFQGPGTNYCWLPTFTLDTAGKAHIAYTLQSSPYNILYLTNRSGSWVEQTVGTFASFAGAAPVLAVGDDGVVHLVKAEGGTLTYFSRATDGTWSSEAMFAGNVPAVAVDAAGTPYVSYRNGSTVYVAYRTGAAAWTSTPIDAGAGASRSTAVRIDGAGVVHVAYAAPGAARVRYAKSPAYAPEDVGVIGDSPSVSLAIDGKNRPYVGYINTSGGAVVVAERPGAWSGLSVGNVANPLNDQIGVGVDAAGNLHAAYTNSSVNAVNHYERKVGRTDEYAATGSNDMAMAVDSGGHVHFLFTKITAGSNPVYTTNASGTWQETNLEGVVAQHENLAIDAWNGVHAVYTNNGAGVVRYGQRGAGGAWTLQSIDSGSRPKLAVDAAGNRLIVYQGSGIEYATAVSGGAFTANQGIAGGTAPDMMMDAAGTAHLVYLSAGILRYRSRSGGAWSAAENIDSVGSSSRAAVFARNGIVHVGYWNNAANTVSYAVKRNGGWTKTVLDRSISSNDAPALAVLADDSVVMLYDDYTTARIKVATNASGGWSVSRFAVGERQTELGLGPADALHGAFVGTSSDGYYGLHHLRDFFGVMPASSTTRVSAW